MTEEVRPVSRNGMCMRVERRLAMPVGRGPQRGPQRRPTETEARDDHARRTERHERLLDEWAEFDTWHAHLAAHEDSLTAAILTLHSMIESDHGPVCDGCPPDNEFGPPPWPCETVAVVAKHHLCDPPPTVPDTARPNPDRPPQYQDPADWTPLPSIRDLFVSPEGDHRE